MRDTRTAMRQGPRRAAGAAMLAVCLAVGGIPLAAAEVLDRVLAVVSGTVIMLSDAGSRPRSTPSTRPAPPTRWP